MSLFDELTLTTAVRDYSASESITALMRASDGINALLRWHAAMPLVDHDGGDEDDRLVEMRRFLRACRKPRANYFRQGDRLCVVQEPEMRPLVPMRFGDPGDEDDGRVPFVNPCMICGKNAGPYWCSHCGAT